MKNFLVSLLMAVLVFTGVDLFAGSIDYLINESADWVRTFSRNAAYDGADAVHYNPAGTAMMEDGLYLNVNNQIFIKDYRMKVDWDTPQAGYDDEYKTTYPTLILPSIFAIFKKDDFAGFAAFTVPAGGGTVDYEDGVPFFMSLPLLYGTSLKPGTSSFKGSSMYLAGTLGGSYKIIDILSVSAGIRYIHGIKTYEAEAQFNNGLNPEIDAKKTADGVAGIFGIDVKPVKELNIAVRYEMQTNLEWETKTDKLNGLPKVLGGTTTIASLKQFEDGYKEKRALPAVLGLGVSYDFLEMFRVSASFTYYFIKLADDKDDIVGSGPTAVYFTQTVSYDDDHENGFEIGGALEYMGIGNLVLSVGYSYSDTGVNEDTISDFEYPLDSHTVCLGAKYTFFDGFSATLAYGRSFYLEGDTDWTDSFGGGKEKWNKSINMIAVGVEYKVL